MPYRYSLELCNLTSLAPYQCNFRKAVSSRLTEKTETCPKPCSASSYEVSAASVKHPQNVSILTFQFASKEVEVHEELFIYDFSSIVASVGGLLGLFVGISLLDILWGVVEYVYTSVKVAKFGAIKTCKWWHGPDSRCCNSPNPNPFPNF